MLPEGAGERSFSLFFSLFMNLGTRWNLLRCFFLARDSPAAEMSSSSCWKCGRPPISYTFFISVSRLVTVASRLSSMSARKCYRYQLKRIKSFETIQPRCFLILSSIGNIQMKFMSFHISRK